MILPKRVLTCFVFCAAFGVSCATKPQFIFENGQRRHLESGIIVPEKIPGWTETSVDTRISQEIVATLNYEREIPPEGLEVPHSAIFLMRGQSTQNLKVVENRLVSMTKDMKFLKTDSVRLKNKKRVLMSTYLQEFESSDTSGSGVKVRKSGKRMSIFATHLNDSTKVVMSVYNPGSAKEKEHAYEFVQFVLFPFVKRCLN